MKKIFVWFSIFIVGLIAFYDAKERLEQLDETAANTPAQVEMQQMINEPDNPLKKDVIFETKNLQENHNKIYQEKQLYQKNQLENIDKRRDTIKNQIDWQKN